MMQRKRLKILLGVLLVLVINIGCPVFPVMETAKIDKTPVTRDPLAVGNLGQIDFCGTVKTDTAGKMSSVPYLIEGRLRWIIIGERLESMVNCGTSGIGGSMKLQLIRNPCHLALQAGGSGLPFIFLVNARGCIFGNIIMSNEIGKTNEIYTGCKCLYWAQVSETEGREEFTALGGFIGLKTRKFAFEAGVYKTIDELDNRWGKQGFIPFVGFSINTSTKSTYRF